MTDRRKEALKEIACAIAESTIDAWLAGELTADGLETHSDKGINHEKDKTKAPAKRRKSKKGSKGLR